MATLDVTVWTMYWDTQKAQWNFVYFISLDTLTKTQWEAAVRGWGLAWFWYDATMLVLCPDASTTTAAQELVKYL